MRTFTQLDTIAAGIPEANIDTDQILAGRYLKTIKRDGLGEVLFYSMRFDDKGQERRDFVLNRKPWRSAGILITLDNFGCGSSREHAPWALVDFGIRAIIAPSFADIFRGNCYKNGILPIELERRQVERLLVEASAPATARMTIDLPEQELVTSLGEVIRFRIAAEHKEQLLLGLDEIAASERLLGEVATFEAGVHYVCPSIPRSF